ncbi:MAG TPA: patatin-like phospholipase family protein [Euzebyales bacterium]|nr:patatin-like phospholipase family protein [Euzebyales bacterium]
MAPTDGPIRISVSVSGGASLGAYHAGVLAALTTALQAVQDDERGMRLDAIGGASAGALASMFTVHGLLNGLDSAEILHQAWSSRCRSTCYASAAPGRRWASGSGAICCR